MRKMLFICCAVFALNIVAAQEIDLHVKNIPDSLRENATAVTRYEKNVFEVTAVDKANYQVHYITTVLAEVADHHLTFQFFSDKFRKLGDVEIKVYDASGKQINKYKKKDLSTYNIGEGLIDDGVRNYFVVNTTVYPITVECKYNVEYKGILSYPDYRFAWPQLAVMNSSFTAIVPKALGLRFKPKNTTLAPVVKTAGATDTYHWSVNNQRAIQYEDGVVRYGKSYPYIMLAPTRFKIDNYEGEMTSWQSYGAWYRNVLEGTDKLPEARQAFYKDLVKNAASDMEKAQIVYEYMQKNFRYVSIQLGIGGQRPLTATFTDEKKYGDCKGLSMFMYAVLKTLGIKSHMVLINRETYDDGVDPDFASNRFNHAILMIPDGKENIWLECTSKTALFGSLDASTENRNAVVITDKGGVLMNTPVSQSKNNTFRVSTVIELDEEGGGVCKSNIQATGEYKEELLNYLAETKKDEQKQYLVRRIGYKQPDEIVISRIEDPRSYHTNVTLAIEKVSEFTAGSKMFLAPHIYKFWSFSMPATQKRERDYYFETPFIKTDTTIYKLPEGFEVDVLPPSKSFECGNASYSTSHTYDAGSRTIKGLTTLELKNHRIVPAEYQELKLFFDKVLKEESQRLVIKRS